MKIGILTYHRSINYGAVMQAYALSCRLKEIPGVEAEIIDYMSARMDRYYKLFTIYRGKNGIFRIFDRIQMYRAFEQGIRQLPLSEQKLVTDDSRKFFRMIDGKYDLIIVGSDAVWNYEKRGLPNPYFLPEHISAVKMSYAASCNGIHYEKLNEEKLEILKKAFQDFEYLGVRDTLTQKVTGRALGTNRAEHNCDPTLLLDFGRDGLGEDFKEQLLHKLITKYKWNPEKKHIGLMLSNLNGNLAQKLVSEIRKKYGEEYQIAAVYSYCKYADIPYIADLTPFEWSRIFSLFDLTFSKYFHGTLLSILNGTPVISLSAETEAEGIPAKVEDLLTRLDLMDFYCPAKNAESLEWNSFMEKVDRFLKNPPKEQMRKGLELERKSADAFLRQIAEMAESRK